MALDALIAALKSEQDKAAMDGLGTAARSDGATDGDTVDLLYSLEFGLRNGAQKRASWGSTRPKRMADHPATLSAHGRATYSVHAHGWLLVHQDRRDPWPLIVEFHV